MAEKGLLSILVPVYQVKEYLPQCMDSILRQSVAFEVWLVDDGSTDGSGAVCDDYAARDARVHVIHKPNGGLASARLAGIRAARGEYLAFVDSDDWVDDDLFEKLLVPMQQDAEIDSAVGGYVTETATGSQQGLPLLPCSETFSAMEAGRRMFASRGFNWSLWGKAYRSELFHDAEFLARWPQSYGEDSFISYHLLQRMRKAAYVPVQGYHYRMRETSMMHQPYHTGWMAYFAIYDEIFEDARKRDPQLSQEILNVIVGMGLSMRKRLLEEGAYPEDAARMKHYFQKWLPWMDALWTPQLRHRWEACATVSAEAYGIQQREREDSLRQFAQGARELYLYGTGAYGRRFARWLDQQNIPWKGAIESVPKNKAFSGKPVLSPQDLAGKDASVIIAMNAENTAEVLPLLKEAGVSNVLEGWKLVIA